MEDTVSDKQELSRAEAREWIDSIDYVLEHGGDERAAEILSLLHQRAQQAGVRFTAPSGTPYLNTISHHDQQPYPGSREIERRIKSIIRWNAMAMVVKANRDDHGIGGHISSYASSATLWEVAFNHFLRGYDHKDGPDLVYFQGHSSPGVYARAFLEGRLDKEHLEAFRHEISNDKGLSSYPHPRLMPEFWQFPTVSMGLSPIQAIYQARFNRYLTDRGIKEASDQRVWAFVGDGEMDEPESMGAINLASREELDNLIFVVDCNLQRLDGPVRGNGQVIQELESAFSGAGWNVIKVIWGGDWDPLLDKDKTGALTHAMKNLVDGQAQSYVSAGGAKVREDFFGQDDALLELVENYSDEQIEKMRRGGHDPVKVYNAYARAMKQNGRPTVVLAQTIKGYGLGEAGEGRNVTHKQKELNEQELKQFRSRFGIPISDKEVAEAPFYKPDDDSEEMKYLRERREELGGFLPKRRPEYEELPEIPEKAFQKYDEGSNERTVATTMVAVQIVGDLLDDDEIGSHIVPIIPDEARTFGLEALFRDAGIYSHKGQLYEPVDRQSLLYYNEEKGGAILEEGISEAGSISSFIAAGSSYATHGIPMIPFFLFYSMFGFQRIGDLIWAAGDTRARGFLIGGTSGRTTLPGEGLQHQDGNSHALAMTFPNIRAYDPTYAYEVATIIKDGAKRMYRDNEDVIYYITVMNEKYPMPKKPEGAEDGILKGLYRVQKSEGQPRIHLLGSGAILPEARKAADMLREDHGIEADVFSATSWKALYDDAIRSTRARNLHPGGKEPEPYVTQLLSDGLPAVAATDYIRAVPLSVASFVPGGLSALGTDGFGQSDNRGALRDHFEVDARYIVLEALSRLAEKGEVKQKQLKDAIKSMRIDPDKAFSGDV
ncbi:MAG: pyruvate dehydrogenase (acetyl-transferring), homodimeric type [Spirochaetota bacterium]